MKELVIISGKGGTGKTSLTAAFAALAQNKVLCDADVDAADLHLVMAPKIKKETDFQSGHKANIDKEKCIECGLCRELCRWGAISEDYTVDSIECEGCGVCFHFCPENAINFPENTCGKWFISDTRFGPMVHAKLGVAEENSGKLVSLVRSESKKLAKQGSHDLIITDGAPGVGCPVIASIGGANAVLVVTEPTVSGAHDMERVLKLASHFSIPAMVCINKFDLNKDKAREIELITQEKNAVFTGQIPFNNLFTEAMVQGKNIIEYDPGSDAANTVKQIWDRVKISLFENPKQ